jgi:hypothetical protein
VTGSSSAKRVVHRQKKKTNKKNKRATNKTNPLEYGEWQFADGSVRSADARTVTLAVSGTLPHVSNRTRIWLCTRDWTVWCV